ncbi:HNH endonuclease [Selenomonas sp. FC4001]|uniref:HNH endonuclease n=1 Tax=Selenomonas sp. FC4001 TaxID=1408313 RepID=UPI00055B516D|nr:HNH endonuclease [Selenomonas sp. FC4001]
MNRKYFLIPANYLTFDFKRLLDSGDNGRILWQYNSNDPKNMEVGDVCYLYYSNLPDNTSRIILRGIITAIGVRDIASDGTEITCFALSQLETINWKNSGKSKFTYKVLHDTYGINIRPNKRQLKDERIGKGKTVGDLALREKLETYYENNPRLNLEQLKEELCVKLRCAFDSTDGDPKESRRHITFEARNGLNYFETHHFIQQHLCKGKEDQALFDAIYHEKNLIYLCPTCHKKIHYGKKDTVRKMIKTLYNREQEFYDSNFLKLAEAEGFPNVLNWLYKIYGVD